ncbi:hypothetical protein CROQUDRAFT_719623 [Cronartium quercuum f. sp. fusiforme G11]|uniref:Secreted protein n=1 Tax=Cronartium quercuum f. sp. fusiforme G11 TaxID=708437 RepID=A0A9P6TIR1_9BASI|nr:hypothetical protein CROQUDRAFT_719623 [Cronartium quercuum f. sp. fusiforme G11]
MVVHFRSSSTLSLMVFLVLLLNLSQAIARPASQEITVIRRSLLTNGLNVVEDVGGEALDELPNLVSEDQDDDNHYYEETSTTHHSIDYKKGYARGKKSGYQAALREINRQEKNSHKNQRPSTTNVNVSLTSDGDKHHGSNKHRHQP